MIRILVISLILGGCALLEETQEAKEARYNGHREKCTELGFNPDDVSHTQCVLQLEQSYLAASQGSGDWVHQQNTNHCAPDFVTGGCL